MSAATDAAEASLQSVVLVNDDQLQEHSAVGENEGMIIYTTTSDITQNDESGDVSHEELQIVTQGSDGSNVLLSGAVQGELINQTSGEADNETVELIQISSLAEITGGDNKIWQLVPGGVNISADQVVIVGGDQEAGITSVPVSAVSSGPNGDLSTANLGVVNTQSVQRNPPPEDAPQWAKVINDCEKVGHYYRGWVPTEQDLDIILTLHKQQTASIWGTRQSPAGNRPSHRMMWKSQYVPYDGIPFVNCGSRATVMECQFGPRRRGCKPNEPKCQQLPYTTFKQTCPARIYVKKVVKYPDFAVPIDLDKKAQKIYMDKSFQALKTHGLHSGGEARYYMQLPTMEAHEYHIPESAQPANSRFVHHHITKTYDLSGLSRLTQQDQGGTRLAEPVANKIRELVSSGIQHVTTIRKMLRKFVDRDLFADREAPVRHDLSYFPTVSDLKNHIHTALLDIENGTLPLTEASMDTLALAQDDWRSNWTSNIGGGPHPETVTVTLTQGDDASGHMISKVETHMSDGSTQISTCLTAETAALLARCNPNMFPSIQSVVSREEKTGEENQKLTDLVQSVLTKPTDEAAEEDTPTDTAVHSEADTSSIQKEALEPTPPTEGVQLDLGINETTHGVTEVILGSEEC